MPIVIVCFSAVWIVTCLEIWHFCLTTEDLIPQPKNFVEKRVWNRSDEFELLVERAQEVAQRASLRVPVELVVG